jgi:hypothetical protein
VLSIHGDKAARADLGRGLTHRSYRVERIQAVDMFPHADHMENDPAARGRLYSARSAVAGSTLHARRAGR